jgi:hypothetical protein
MYLGSPFIGMFALLFALEYVNYVYKPQIAILLAVFPFVVMMLVFTWPLLPLYYADIQRVETAMGPYLKVTPGPLYLPCMIYNFGLAVLTCLGVLRHLMKLKLWKRRNTVVFTISISSVIVVFLLRVTKFTPVWFDPLPLMEVFALFMIALHITWFQQQKWNSVGRELAI